MDETTAWPRGRYRSWFVALTWKEIQAHYKRAFDALGQTQVETQIRGGLGHARLNQIFNNQRDGPSVGDFMKALEGIGMSASEFFRQVERVAATETPIESLPDEENDMPVLPRHTRTTRLQEHPEVKRAMGYLVEVINRVLARRPRRRTKAPQKPIQFEK